MGDIKLTDILDVDALQRIQDAFAKATGMAALADDLDHEVTRLSNPTEFCMTLARGSEKGHKRCSECNLRGGRDAAHTKKPAVYHCYTGLVDFSAPIMLGDSQIGSIVGGQVLTEAPDEQKSRQIAREIEVDEDEYIKALSKIKIVTKEQIEAAAQLLFEISGALSEQGIQKLRLSDSVGEIVNSYARLSERIAAAENAIKSMAAGTSELKANFEVIAASSSKTDKEVEKTGSVLKHIKDVSDQTRILGFNASIEAARSGAAGAGFSVIAQEVRRLADDSQKHSNDISDVLADLEKSISIVNLNVSKIFSSIDENAKTADMLAADMEGLEQETKSLSGLCKKLKA